MLKIRFYPVTKIKKQILLFSWTVFYGLPFNKYFMFGLSLSQEIYQVAYSPVINMNGSEKISVSRG